MGCRFLLQGVFPTEPASPALAGGFLTTEPPGKRRCLEMCLLRRRGGRPAVRGPRGREGRPLTTAPRGLFSVSAQTSLTLSFSFWPFPSARGILDLRPQIEAVSPALEPWSFNHCTTREAPLSSYKATDSITRAPL